MARRRDAPSRGGTGCDARGHVTCALCWPTPICDCGKQMTRGTVKAGEHAGEVFFVCHACAQRPAGPPRPQAVERVAPAPRPAAPLAETPAQKPAPAPTTATPANDFPDGF